MVPDITVSLHLLVTKIQSIISFAPLAIKKRPKTVFRTTDAKFDAIPRLSIQIWCNHRKQPTQEHDVTEHKKNHKKIK